MGCDIVVENTTTSSSNSNRSKIKSWLLSCLLLCTSYLFIVKILDVTNNCKRCNNNRNIKCNSKCGSNNDNNSNITTSSSNNKKRNTIPTNMKFSSFNVKFFKFNNNQNHYHHHDNNHQNYDSNSNSSSWNHHNNNNNNNNNNNADHQLIHHHHHHVSSSSSELILTANNYKNNNNNEDSNYHHQYDTRTAAATTTTTAAAKTDDDDDSKELDCQMRQLMFHIAKRNVESWRTNNDMSDIYNALEIETSCGKNTKLLLLGSSSTNNNNNSNSSSSRSHRRNSESKIGGLDDKDDRGGGYYNRNYDNNDNCYYVCPISGNDQQNNNGNYTHPFLSIQRAIDETRKHRSSSNDRNKNGGSDEGKMNNNNNNKIPMQVIILKKGIHFINKTIILTPDDSNLIIKGEEENETWISGGILINSTTTKWTKLNTFNEEQKSSNNKVRVNYDDDDDKKNNIWVADLTSLLPSDIATTTKEDKIKLITGLFTIHPNHNRMTLARYPNANVEEWNAPNRYSPSNVVKEWIFPPYGKQPTFHTIDLSSTDTQNNPTGHMKNDSSMDDYNKFGIGYGGVCSTVWGNEPSYWCSNVSAGGWAFVDKNAALAGRLNIPIGMKILSSNNSSLLKSKNNNNNNNYDDIISRIIRKWGIIGGEGENKSATRTTNIHNNGRGAIVHVAHSQGWAWHMFNISSITTTIAATTASAAAHATKTKNTPTAIKSTSITTGSNKRLNEVVKGKKVGTRIGSLHLKEQQQRQQEEIQKQEIQQQQQHDQQKEIVIKFDKGGWQGGRNWQCMDKDGHLSDCNGEDKKLHGGDWYVEGILEELDDPGEFYFDYETNLLYFYPPTTTTTTISTKEEEDNEKEEASSFSLLEDEKEDKRYHQLLRHLNNNNNNQQNNSNKSSVHSTTSGQQQNDSDDSDVSDIPDLIATNLQTLIRLSGTMNNPVRNVHIQNIKFRDASKTYMEQWSAPSGGDWSLHKGGAIWLDDGTENITISDCVFTRLDGNAIMISGYARYVTIRQSEFAWLGNGAVATWGNTINNGYDATHGEQPQFCTMENNIVSNIGLYEKQSSGWGQNKAYQNTIRNNVMFNLPRAAINFNDGMGGGNVVEGNVIFNTCRESGDHGPINSWDRMPFLTNATGVPSFTPLMTHTQQNIIMANYGASQGFDNDDGSSWYHTHDNVYYVADGFKMDYGGHDSIFSNNLIVNSDNCFGTGSFLKDHVDKVFNNTCILTSNDHNRNSNNTVGVLFQCTADGLVLYNNTYYTDNGNASWSCAYQKSYTLTSIQNELGLEMGSTQSITPPASTITSWAKEKLQVILN